MAPSSGLRGFTRVGIAFGGNISAGDFATAIAAIAVGGNIRAGDFATVITAIAFGGAFGLSLVAAWQH